MTATRGLVLGGGGLAGIAWEVGVLAGLARAGIDVTDADVVVGTSAGSVVGTVLRAGEPVEDLLAEQLAPPPATLERSVDFDADALYAAFGEAIAVGGDLTAVLATIGTFALAATSDATEDERKAIIRSRLTAADWPAGRLLITAVDTATGGFTVFDRASGVDLVDAVAASCAVPGVWPPVTIAGRRYMDGGVHSSTNAELAAGCDRVLVVAPMTLPAIGPFKGLDAEIAELGAASVVVQADEASVAAFGTNVLDPATRPPSARAGLVQGAAVAAEVAELWKG